MINVFSTNPNNAFYIHQNETSKELSDNEFIEASQTVINSHLFIINSKDQHHLLKQIFNFGLKGCTDQQVAKLQKKYEGLVLSFHALWKAKIGLKILSQLAIEKKISIGFKTLKQKTELLLICKHRLNFINFSSFMNSMFKASDKVDKLFICKAISLNIKNKIKELNSLDPKGVTRLPNGDTCFVIPGGTHSHYVSYEFKKQNDNYFFIIHNRGLGTRHFLIHGLTQFFTNGKTYSKTSVKIQVPREVLENTEFLSNLMLATQYNDIEFVYEIIYHYLIKKGGVILKSDVEVLLNEAYRLLQNPFINDHTRLNLKKIALTLLKLDPSFQSNQIYGSCVESNLIPSETELISVKTKRELKLFALSSLIDELKLKYLSNFHSKTEESAELQREALIAKQNLLEKISKLEQKISQSTDNRMIDNQNLVYVKKQMEDLRNEINENYFLLSENFIINFYEKFCLNAKNEIENVKIPFFTKKDNLPNLLELKRQGSYLMEIFKLRKFNSNSMLNLENLEEILQSLDVSILSVSQEEFSIEKWSIKEDFKNLTNICSTKGVSNLEINRAEKICKALLKKLNNLPMLGNKLLWTKVSNQVKLILKSGDPNLLSPLLNQFLTNLDKTSNYHANL